MGCTVRLILSDIENCMVVKKILATNHTNKTNKNKNNKIVRLVSFVRC